MVWIHLRRSLFQPVRATFRNLLDTGGRGTLTSLFPADKMEETVPSWMKGEDRMTIRYGRLTGGQLAALLPEGQRADEPGLYAIGAEEDGQICGLLLFRAMDELVVDITSISVDPAHRRQGIANGMIDFLCRHAWESTTAVLCTFAAADRDAPLCRLFVRRGDFTLTETEDYLCRVSCAALEEVRLSSVPPAGTRIASFYQLPDQVQRSFLKRMTQEGDGAFAKGLRDEREQMLDPLCLCVVDETETVQAAVFCQRHGEDVSLSLAYSFPGQGRAIMALTGHLRERILAAADRIPRLWIAAVTPQSRKLVETLLPQREITERFYTACWDMDEIGGGEDGRT